MVDVLTFGEAMFALRATGRLGTGAPLTPSVAGAESNAAIGLARLGHRVRWVGRVGADGPGELVLRTLRGEGVDVVATVDDHAPTAALLFEQRLPDVTAVTYWRTGSAGSRLAPGELAEPLAAGARVLLVSGITCALGPDPAAAVTAAVTQARNNGWLVCLDVNHRTRLWDRVTAGRVLAPLAARASVLVGSPDELTLVAGDGLAGDTDHDAVARRLVERGTGEVVVKLGAAGAARFDGHTWQREPARSVAVVDSVGAGDAFTAGYLSAYLDGLAGEERLRRGNAVAAFAVSTRGDWEGLPTRADLALLERAGDALR